MTSDRKKAYSKLYVISARLGITMLLHTAILQGASALGRWLSGRISAFQNMGAAAATVADGAINAAVYLLAFILPAFFCLAAIPDEHHGEAGTHPAFPDDFGFILLPSLGAVLLISDLSGYIFDLVGMPPDAASDLPYGLLGLAVAIINVVILPALCEELLFRGCIYSALEGQGRGVAVVGSALLFALMHNSLRAIPHTFAAGLIFACLRRASASLWPSIVLHLANNALYLFLPLMAARLEPTDARVFLQSSHAAVILLGVISAAVWAILIKKRKRDKNIGGDGMQARTSGCAAEFFSPVMVIYIITAIVLAILRMWLTKVEI